MKHHPTVNEAITSAIESISSRSSASAQSPSQLIWIDMPCNLNTATQTLKSCQGDCLTPQEIELNIQRVTNSSQPGDVICVLTQGDLSEVKKLMCHKQKLVPSSAFPLVLH